MTVTRGSKVFLVVLVLALASVGGALAYAGYLLGGEAGAGRPVAIAIERGATAGTVGDDLADRDVVRSALAFRLVAKSRGLDANILAGRYDLETGMSVDEAIDALLEGPIEPETFRVTVPEGLTVVQTLGRLAEQTDHSVEDYRAVLGSLTLPDWVPALDSFDPTIVREPYEGLLFPETYDFRQDASALTILQRMVDQLSRTYDQVPAEQVEAMQARGYDRYRILIAASLIERETRVDAERRQVAGVVFNRLVAGQALQIDATVLYAIGEHKERVLLEDLEFESAYNTYHVTGLPPTPISGVGKASILSTYDPADVPFVYYVLDASCDGRHLFAVTLDEHNRNVQAFRDAGRCQQ
ncbi:MAG TPA: endolytic transglycosylase MltG [Nitriliruptorales bacterium]